MAEERSSYNQIVMDHLKHPRNMGEMENPDGIGEAQNPVCGDTMRLFIKVEMGRIIDTRFLTFGCGAAIASSSMTTEMIKGKTIDEALLISDQMIAETLGGLPPSKVHCSVLAEKAIRAAVSDYQKRNRPPSPHGGEGLGEGISGEGKEGAQT
jgi:nitrogen fixation NifU-like protein